MAPENLVCRVLMQLWCKCSIPRKDLRTSQVPLNLDMAALRCGITDAWLHLGFLAGPIPV
jgi:hypothetical protein